jgi:hypothetical protein
MNNEKLQEKIKIAPALFDTKKVGFLSNGGRSQNCVKVFPVVRGA